MVKDLNAEKRTFTALLAELSIDTSVDLWE